MVGAAPSVKYEVPSFLSGVVGRASYSRWLRRRAAAHASRDRKRGSPGASVAKYKAAIHAAVCESEGRDAYTGEALDWSHLSAYDNRTT